VVLIASVLYILHRAGTFFLYDCYGSNPALARTIRQLLDLGYFLVCTGYFLLTIQTALPMNTIADVTQILTIKLGIFLLLLGFLHVVNLLLLALFRRHTPLQTAAS
jgi:hypothetical protein